MKANELKELLASGGLEKYSDLYSDITAEAERLSLAIDKFISYFGDGRELYVFSVPGRSEICGNHTDHNRGCVLAGAIDRDIIAIAAKNDDKIIRFHSEGYNPDEVDILETHSADGFERYTSSALIAGVVNGFELASYSVGGFDCYSNTEVLKGSGISSSAAYEVMIGNILSHLYNGGRVAPTELASIAQYAENKYFGKPCGLMDQMACAVGGFVFIDFENADAPVVRPLEFSLKERGYSLCIVNTGGNHADLNEDYASVPAEMKAVAGALGRSVLRGVTEGELISRIPELRNTVGDRAILRAIHFIRENKRVTDATQALADGSLDGFFGVIGASGDSSFKYLQNVYTNLNVREQGLSLALALAENFLGNDGACRVHGGGFAGTVQIFLPTERLTALTALMDSVFGEGASMPLNIRPVGAVRLF